MEKTYSMARYDEGLFRAALIGYRTEKAKIQAAITEIQAQLGHYRHGHPKAAGEGSGPTAPRRRRMTISARRRIAAAQRKRWAAVREAKAAPPKPKRELSVASRKAIIDTMKKRWTAVRAAKAKAARRSMARKAA
jgi:hypothetical protein